MAADAGRGYPGWDMRAAKRSRFDVRLPVFSWRHVTERNSKALKLNFSVHFVDVFSFEPCSFYEGQNFTDSLPFLYRI